MDGETGPALDVVVVADLRADRLPDSTLVRLRELVADGRRVGVVHLESLVDAGAAEHPVAPAVRELIRHGEIERIYLDDARETALTVVADPTVMQFPPLVTPRLVSGRVDVLADAATEGTQYARTDVAQHVRALLGADPRWHDGSWPVPPSAPAQPVAGRHGAGTLVVSALDQPVSAGDLVVESWLLREPADGERGARLSVVRLPGAGTSRPPARELSDAWAAGDRPWQTLAADWLERSPEAWAVVVQTVTGVRLVVARGVHATVDDGAVRLTGGTDGAAEMLRWHGTELVRGPVGAQ